MKLVQENKVLLTALLMGSLESPIIGWHREIKSWHRKKICEHCPKRDCCESQRCSRLGYCVLSRDEIRRHWTMLLLHLRGLLEKIELRNYLTPKEIINFYTLYRPIFLEWIQKNKAILVDQSVENMKKRLTSKAYRKTLFENPAQRQNLILFLRDIPKNLLGSKDQRFWKKIRAEIESWNQRSGRAE